MNPKCVILNALSTKRLSRLDKVISQMKPKCVILNALSTKRLSRPKKELCLSFLQPKVLCWALILQILFYIFGLCENVSIWVFHGVNI